MSAKDPAKKILEGVIESHLDYIEHNLSTGANKEFSIITELGQLDQYFTQYRKYTLNGELVRYHQRLDHMLTHMLNP